MRSRHYVIYASVPEISLFSLSLFLFIYTDLLKDMFVLVRICTTCMNQVGKFLLLMPVAKCSVQNHAGPVAGEVCAAFGMCLRQLNLRNLLSKHVDFVCFEERSWIFLQVGWHRKKGTTGSFGWWCVILAPFW